MCGGNLLRGWAVRSDLMYDRAAAAGGANPWERAHRPNVIPHTSLSALWCCRQSTRRAPLYVQSKSRESLGCDHRLKTHTKPPPPDLTSRRPPTERQPTSLTLYRT